MIGRMRQKFFLCLLMGITIFSSNAHGKEDKASSSGKRQQILNKENLVRIGNPKAPVYVDVYLSMTCSHCATFHTKDYPKLQKNIEKGIVSINFYDFPLDRLALMATQIAWAKGAEYYPKIASVLFQYQKEWMNSSNPEETLVRVAKRAGLTDDEVAKARLNKDLQRSILTQRLIAQKERNVESTPTFFINDQKNIGYITYEKIKSLIDEELEKKSIAKHI